MKRIIFHVDMDAFFASVEQRDNPQYRGKPLIVGARPGNRGVVSTASYEARKFGIHSAMPINEAFNRCPQGVYITPRMEVYERVSEEIMRIFTQFSPQIERVSVDEAFIDMTGSEKLFGEPLEAAGLISQRIKKQQGLTASIGIAPNKFVAKIASDFNKPDGITCTPFDNEQLKKWLAPLSVRRMWGVGRRSEEIFNRCSVNTIGDMQKLSMDYLCDHFGKQGMSFYYLCRGIDNRSVKQEEAVRSISREHTFNLDCSDRQEWKKTLHLLSQDVARQARSCGVKASSISLCYRRPDFSRHSRRKTLKVPTNLARIIYETVLEILDSLEERSLRLIGVGITGLDQLVQGDLFSDPEIAGPLEASERAVDKINARFGSEVIKKGLEVGLKTSKEEYRQKREK